MSTSTVRLLSPCAALLLRLEFLSTPSARRATFQHRYQERVTLISIHALREEGDALDYAAKIKHAQFLSTPSARRATGLGDKWFQDHQISIHALREEGDHSPASSAPMALYFYPRPPRGGRPTRPSVVEMSRVFLSTPSARRATCVKGEKCNGTDHFYPRPPRGGRPDGGDG